jgi:methyltransferase (TIGR00027 family)
VVRLLPEALHTSDRPSFTAETTTFGRALELDRPAEQRIVTDEFAPVFLSARARLLLAGLRAGRPAVRIAERAELAGLATYSLCRHRFIDDHLLAALDSIAQVLVLGAGYDARAYRFAAQLGERAVVEVDLPPISRRKAGIVAAHPELFAGNRVERVEIDFRAESLADRLAASAFDPGAPTFVAWEGVIPYLSRDAVEATLGTLAQFCGTGSVLAADLWQARGRAPFSGLRRLAARGFALIGEPVTFAMSTEDVAPFLAGHGWQLTDLADHQELAARHATDGRTCEPSLYVIAAVR